MTPSLTGTLGASPLLQAPPLTACAARAKGAQGFHTAAVSPPTNARGTYTRSVLDLKGGELPGQACYL